jgi:hypothetical protein
MNVPNNFYHKATNESFNGSVKISIYYNSLSDLYFVMMGGATADEEQGWYFTKTQLELVIQAGKDVLDDERV